MVWMYNGCDPLRLERIVLIFLDFGKNNGPKFDGNVLIFVIL